MIFKTWRMDWLTFVFFLLISFHAFSSFNHKLFSFLDLNFKNLPHPTRPWICSTSLGEIVHKGRSKNMIRNYIGKFDKCTCKEIIANESRLKILSRHWTMYLKLTTPSRKFSLLPFWSEKFSYKCIRACWTRAEFPKYGINASNASLYCLLKLRISVEKLFESLLWNERFVMMVFGRHCVVEVETVLEEVVRQLNKRS